LVGKANPAKTRNKSCGGALEESSRVSKDSAGAEGDSDSLAPSISPDGRYVASYSFAANLVSNDTNGSSDVSRAPNKQGVGRRQGSR